MDSKRSTTKKMNFKSFKRLTKLKENLGSSKEVTAGALPHTFSGKGKGIFFFLLLHKCASKILRTKQVLRVLLYG